MSELAPPAPDRPARPTYRYDAGQPEITVKRVKLPPFSWRLRFRLWRLRRRWTRDLERAGMLRTLEEAQRELTKWFLFGTDPAAEWARKREEEMRSRAYRLHRQREGGRALRRAFRKLAEDMAAFSEGLNDERA